MVSVYIDDIIIYTPTVDEHLKLLRKVLLALREGGFYINWAKSVFLRKEALYLGHIISENMLKPDPAKIRGLASAGAPQDKRALVSFCAAANYLRAYIPRFAELMEPLTRLSSKYVRFAWGDEQETAFQRVKEALVNACYLKMPNWGEPFIMFTDASEVAVAAALAQVDEREEGLNFLAFGSKKLTETQKRWSPTERELYAIVWGCEHFENIVKGAKLLVYSDHQSLSYLTSINAPKIVGWAIRLSEFNPCVKHIAGIENNVADWLSRTVPEDETGLPDYMFVPEVYHLLHEPTELYTLPLVADMTEQAKIDEQSLVKGTLDWYSGVAYGRRTQKLFIPTKFRERMLLWFHASGYGGHQGVVRTVNRLKKNVWWPGMHQDVEEFIKSCPICNATKSLRTSHGREGALDSPHLFRVVSIDHIGPRTFKSKKFYILVIVDHYSRYMAAVASEEATAAETVAILRDHWASKFGAPAVVLADRGTAFTSALFRRYIEQRLQARVAYASVQYPQGNGINESAHRILETAIKTRVCAKDDTIEDIIADAVLVYNVTPNRMIGDTPASLVFGTDLHLPGLQEFEPEPNEEARLTKIRDYRNWKLLQKQLVDIEDQSQELSGKGGLDEFKIGDIVTYTLSHAERQRAVHFSGEPKYAASRSFPCRVAKITDNDLVMTPLWTKGIARKAPKTQCRRITTFIPERMKAEIQQLYPKAPWKPNEEDAKEITPHLDKPDELKETVEDIAETPSIKMPNEGPITRKRKRQETTNEVSVKK